MTAPELPRRALVCYRSDRKGGCATRFARMMLALVEGGVEVHCASELPFPVEHPNLTYHRLGNLFGNGDGLPAWTWFMALTPGRLAALAQQVKPDAIVVFSGLYGWLARRAARAAGAPLLVFARSRPGSQSRWLERLLIRKGFRAADGVIVQSEAGRSMMHQWAGVPEAGMEVLPNDAPVARLDDAARAEAREKLLKISGAPEDGFLVAVAGRLAANKGIETILACARRLGAARVHFVIFGDGPLRRRYESQAASGRTHFCGWQEGLQRLLAACDLAVTASLTEGSPNALLESLGAGLPCLGGDIPEVREILLHEELLFPVSDAAALAARLEETASAPEHLDRLRALSAERAAACAFDWNARLRETVARLFRSAGR